MENPSSTADGTCGIGSCSGSGPQGNHPERSGPEGPPAERDYEHGHDVFLAGNFLAKLERTYEAVNELIPLLEKEGWREAPGWSVLDSWSRMTTPSAPSAQPPLLFEEGNLGGGEMKRLMKGLFGGFLSLVLACNVSWAGRSRQLR